MNHFYSGSVDGGAPWNPIIINSSDSDTSTDGGVKLTTDTPSSAYFSLHEGPTHSNLHPNFPIGNRIEVWFKGVYGDADVSSTASYDSSSDSESSYYYDADSEHDFSESESDSDSSTSVVNSAFYEWNAHASFCTLDPIMGSYGSDSDPVYYIWDSDLGSYTTDSDSSDWETNTSSDTSPTLSALLIPGRDDLFRNLNNFSGAYTSNTDSASWSDYTSDSETISYSSSSVSSSDSGSHSGFESSLDMNARLQMRLRLRIAEAQTLMEENLYLRDQLRNIHTVLTKPLN